MGQNAVVIGKSRMVGTPMAAMLSSGGATVTQCDVHTDRTTLERKVCAANTVDYFGGWGFMLTNERLRSALVLRGRAAAPKVVRAL